MGLFLKYLIQLILSPGNAWEDLAHDDPEPEALLHEGYLSAAWSGLGNGILWNVISWRGTVAGTCDGNDHIRYILRGRIYRQAALRFILRAYGRSAELDRRRAMQYIISGLGLMLLSR